MASGMKQAVTTKTAHPGHTQGMLLGIVLDLSGSMQTTLRNNDRGEYSRIESLSKSFQRAIEDIEKLLESKSTNDQTRLRLFSYGFGLLDCGQPVCDVLASIDLLDKKLAHYRPLQPELEENWLFEVNRILEEKRIPGDAQEDLRRFIEAELRDKAISAEQKRSLVKLQHWCETTYLKFVQYKVHLRGLLVHTKYLFILTPLVVSLLWLLRLPILIVSYFNNVFENWVQSRLKDIRTNADRYSTALSTRVITHTEKAIDTFQQKIYATIIDSMVEFIDRQAFHLIQLYDHRSSVTRRKKALNWNEFQNVYNEVARKIENIIRPHANQAWKKNLFILKRAARILGMTPNWDALRIKTIECAHQAVWIKIEPYVRHMAEEVAKQRFIRAVIATIIQATEKKEVTLSIEDSPELVKFCKEAKISIEELPIFGLSPLGEALSRVSDRFEKEMSLPKNRILRPVLLIVSDGRPNGKVSPFLIAKSLKTLGITIICCYVTNKNLGRSWVLRRNSVWFWPNDAKLMFSMASTVDDWSEFGERLKDSRFKVRRHAKLFVQINHSEYLENFIKAVLLPLEREHRFIKPYPIV